MPYQPAGEDVEFYASVHVGPDTPLAALLPGVNKYLQTASTLLRWGTSYGGVGVYLPFEDAWMLDRIPQDHRTPGANYVWEMRYAVTPDELDGHHPLWISHAFLQEAS